MYESEIVLGRRYRDEDTNFKGVADRVSFSRGAYVRVCLRALVGDIPVEHWFDEPHLVRLNDEGQTGFKAEAGVHNGLRGE